MVVVLQRSGAAASALSRAVEMSPNPGRASGSCTMAKGSARAAAGRQGMGGFGCGCVSVCVGGRGCACSHTIMAYEPTQLVEYVQLNKPLATDVSTALL
jgi:hypothetical protein